MAGWDVALSTVPGSKAAVCHPRGIRPGDRVPEEAREAGMMAQHPLGEEIQDFADGRLTPVRRVDLEAHLAMCPQCARELERLHWVKEGTARLPMHEPPPDLPARVALVLDTEDRRASHARPLRRYLLPAAGVLAAAAAVVILVTRGPRDLPSAVARDFATYGAGKVAGTTGHQDDDSGGCGQDAGGRQEIPPQRACVGRPTVFGVEHQRDPSWEIRWGLMHREACRPFLHPVQPLELPSALRTHRKVCLQVHPPDRRQPPIRKVLDLFAQRMLCHHSGLTGFLRYPVARAYPSRVANSRFRARNSRERNVPTGHPSATAASS